MKQALTDIVAERLKNAFLANFIFSWVVVNHSLLLYFIFSEDTPNKKLELLKKLEFDWATDLGYPLVLVFAYAYLLPLVNLGLMKLRLKYIEPLLADHRNTEQSFNYDRQIAIEDKRLDLVFREKEREIEIEEKRTEKQIVRTQAAEAEAKYFAEKQVAEAKNLELEKAKRLELEKVVKLDEVVTRQRLLDERESMLKEEKERLVNESLRYDLRRNQALWIAFDKPVSVGDRVVIDFVGSIDGVEFEGGSAKDFTLEIGQGRMIPGFEDGLIGSMVGDEVSVSVKFPEDYLAVNLRGKDALFNVKIQKLETPMVLLNNPQ